MTIPTEVDIIIAGGSPLQTSTNIGGATGCVVAGRLARADPTLQILIVESGNDNRDNPLIRTPAYFAHNLKPDSKKAHLYVSKPSSHVAGRSNIVSTGGVLGGGSSINFMMYTRASASDYDDWNTEGWTFNDLKPLLLKVILHLIVITLDRDVSCGTRRSESWI